MAVDWNRVRLLEQDIADATLSRSGGGISDPATLARENAARKELNYILGGNARLEGGIDASRSEASSAVGSARSGVQAILAGKPDIDRAVGDMRNAANAMLPIADTMRGEGDAMFDSGTKVTEQALETLGTGLGFIRMDSSASPLVAEALRLYGEFDPDKYVAAAAQDVQAQGDNARAQGMRNLSRMGVSPTSGASQALNQLYDRSLAVARAAAMTRARERGLTDQATQFQNLVTNNANTFLKTGGELASIGTSARAQGVNAQQGAADVLGKAGGLFGNAGELGLNYNRALMGAYDALAGMQMRQASNTLAGEQMRLNARRGGGVASTNTGRHYGVGGELLETGNDKIDAMLQAARDAVPTTYEKNLGLA